MSSDAIPDPAEISRRLREAGIETGMSKSGKLIRIDNRNAGRSTDPGLIASALLTGTLREIHWCEAHELPDSFATLLAGQADLQILDLENSEVSAEMFAAFERMPGLRILNVRGTRVPAEQIAASRKVMIGTRIIG